MGMNIWKNLEGCLPSELLYEYSQAFHIMDRNKTGKMSIHELSTVVSSLGINLSKSCLYQYIQHVVNIDVTRENDNARIFNFEKFVTIMAAIITECIPEDEVLKVFQTFDADGDGYISKQELQSVLADIGDGEFSEEEIADMITEADRDGDGFVSLDEFIAVISTSQMMQTRISASLLTSSDDESSTAESEESCRVSFDSCYKHSVRKYSSFSVYLVEGNLKTNRKQALCKEFKSAAPKQSNSFISKCIRAARNSLRMR